MEINWHLNVTRLPKLPFESALLHLTWREIGELCCHLESLGYLGDMRVMELLETVDRFLVRGDREAHNEAYEAFGEERRRIAKERFHAFYNARRNRLKARTWATGRR